MNKLWMRRVKIEGGILRQDGELYDLFLRFKVKGSGWIRVSVTTAYEAITGQVVQELIDDKYTPVQIQRIREVWEPEKTVTPSTFIHAWLEMNLGIFHTRIPGSTLSVSPRYYAHVSSRANPDMVLCWISDVPTDHSLYYLIHENWVVEEHLDGPNPYLTLRKNAEMMIMPEAVYIAQAFEEEIDE